MENKANTKLEKWKIRLDPNDYNTLLCAMDNEMQRVAGSSQESLREAPKSVFLQSWKCCVPTLEEKRDGSKKLWFDLYLTRDVLDAAIAITKAHVDMDSKCAFDVQVYAPVLGALFKATKMSARDKQTTKILNDTVTNMSEYKYGCFAESLVIKNNKLANRGAVQFKISDNKR